MGRLAHDDLDLHCGSHLAIHLTAVLFHDGDPYRSWWRNIRSWSSRRRPIYGEGITDIQSMTQAQYDALEEKSPTTIYMIDDDVQDDDKA